MEAVKKVFWFSQDASLNGGTPKTLQNYHF